MLAENYFGNLTPFYFLLRSSHCTHHNKQKYFHISFKFQPWLHLKLMMIAHLRLS